MLPPVIISTAAGVRAASKDHVNAALSFGANRWQVLWHVILPGEDQWIHAFTGEAFSAGSHTVAAPIGTPPVFYRPGSRFADLFAGLAAL